MAQRSTRGIPMSNILEVVLEREPGRVSIQFSAYGCIAPKRRLTCVASTTCPYVRRVVNGPPGPLFQSSARRPRAA